MTTAPTRAAHALTNLRGLPFTKGHGTGNDFVLLTDAAGQVALGAAEVAALCHRRFGVGGDGLIRAVRSENIPEGRALVAAEPRAEWFMDYWNADGSWAQMCGNGVRVFVDYLVHEGLLSFEGSSPAAIATRAGVKYVQRSKSGYTVGMGEVHFGALTQGSQSAYDCLVTARGERVARPGLSVEVGNPHVVVALASDAQLGAVDLSQAPRVEPAAEQGVNVEFVVPADPLVRGGEAHIRMRVYERGSAETLSCGTGACAAAAAVRLWAGQGAPQVWNVSLPGGVLRVHFRGDELDAIPIELAGPTAIVARGVVGS